MQPISHQTEVKHCSSFCSLIVNPELKLTAKNRQKLTAHGLKNPVLQNIARPLYIYIYICLFFFPRREGNRIKALEVYRIKTLEVYRIKTLEVYRIKTLEVYRIKTLEVYRIKTLEVYHIKTLEVYLVTTLEVYLVKY